MLPAQRDRQHARHALHGGSSRPGRHLGHQALHGQSLLLVAGLAAAGISRTQKKHSDRKPINIEVLTQ